MRLARAGRRPAPWLLALALAAAPAACGGDDDDDGAGPPDAAVPPDASIDAGVDAAPADVCDPAAGEGVAFDLDALPCEKLSSYRFFSDGPAQVPNDGVWPYDLNTALFSDYASKHRFVWLPPGEVMTYDPDGVFELPVGSVIIKTFSYLADLRDPSSAERLVETRLLIHRAERWEGVVYVWNEEQTEAELKRAGAIVPVEWIHTDGEPRKVSYIVPNTNQCVNCHVVHIDGQDITTPIGPQARHLNRDVPGQPGQNQLVAWTEAGILTGAPADPAEAPRAPVFDDPETGTLDERARAWLDVNCAHCHSQVGPARTSGLDLSIAQTDPAQYGVCKTPIAAGPGSGGRLYDIVPGLPDDSILLFRTESVAPEIRMPELLRQLVHDESNTLLREWITSLDGDCAPPT